MTDAVEKLLLAAVGFVLGTATTLIVDLVRARRHRTGLVNIIRAEARAFVAACRWAEKSRSWTSTDARRLAILIQERFSKDPERWTACKPPAAQRAVADLYLECAALIDLINRHEEQERRAPHGEAPVISQGTYEGIAKRTEKLLGLLGESEVPRDQHKSHSDGPRQWAFPNCFRSPISLPIKQAPRQPCCPSAQHR
jgi:hypothetical protein